MTEKSISCCYRSSNPPPAAVETPKSNGKLGDKKVSSEYGCCTSVTAYKIMFAVGLIFTVIFLLGVASFCVTDAGSLTNTFKSIRDITSEIATFFKSDGLVFASFGSAIFGTFTIGGLVGWLVTNCAEAERRRAQARKDKEPKESPVVDKKERKLQHSNGVSFAHPDAAHPRPGSPPPPGTDPQQYMAVPPNLWNDLLKRVQMVEQVQREQTKDEIANLRAMINHFIQVVGQPVSMTHPAQASDGSASAFRRRVSPTPMNAPVGNPGFGSPSLKGKEPDSPPVLGLHSHPHSSATRSTQFRSAVRANVFASAPSASSPFPPAPPMAPLPPASVPSSIISIVATPPKRVGSPPLPPQPPRQPLLASPNVPQPQNSPSGQTGSSAATVVAPPLSVVVDAAPQNVPPPQNSSSAAIEPSLNSAMVDTGSPPPPPPPQNFTSGQADSSAVAMEPSLSHPVEPPPPPPENSSSSSSTTSDSVAINIGPPGPPITVVIDPTSQLP